MPSSTYVTAQYFSPGSTDLDGGIVELVSDPCWLRGILYYNAQKVQSDVDNEDQMFRLHNGNNVGETELYLPITSERSWSQVFVPDGGYLDFDDGIFISCALTDNVDKVAITLFLTI